MGRILSEMLQPFGSPAKYGWSVTHLPLCGDFLGADEDWDWEEEQADDDEAEEEEEERGFSFLIWCVTRLPLYGDFLAADEDWDGEAEQADDDEAEEEEEERGFSFLIFLGSGGPTGNAAPGRARRRRLGSWAERGMRSDSGWVYDFFG